MEKIKLLTLVVITLVLLNFGTLGYLFFADSKENHPHPEHGREGKPKPREIIIEKLHFDANQQMEYDKLIQWHRGETTKLDGNIRDMKNELYLLLNENPVDEKEKVSLIDAISALQRQIEAIHFKHFEDIKKLCKPEQKEDFRLLTQELSKIFGKKKNPKPQHE